MNNEPELNPYHTILLVEDDMKLSALVVEYLEKNGLQIETEFRVMRLIFVYEESLLRLIFS